jgi:hypothetical protein
MSWAWHVLVALFNVFDAGSVGALGRVTLRARRSGWALLWIGDASTVPTGVQSLGADFKNTLLDVLNTRSVRTSEQTNLAGLNIRTVEEVGSTLATWADVPVISITVTWELSGLL